MDSVYRTDPIPDPPSAFNMAAHVLAAGSATPDKLAMQIVKPSGAQRWSYGRLIAAVRGAGSLLLETGLTPGDRVMLRLGNGPEFPIAFLGAIAAGLVPVPTSAQLTEAEITKLAADLDPAAVVAGDGIALPDHPARVIPAEILRKAEDAAPCDYAMGDPNRLAYMIFTSGTGGSARAVMHAHRAIWARQMMYRGWYGMGPDDRLMHAGAFNWTYTLGTGLMDPWTLGATALIPADGVEPRSLPLLLKRFDATIFAAAPGVYRQILKHHETLSLPKLRHGLSAGEALPEPTRMAWNAATGTKVYEALGMSECSTFISGSPDHPAPPGTCGYPQAGRHVAVLGEDWQPVPRGEPGQLAIHESDPGLYLGYWNAPEETAARRVGPWFVTGDTVSMGEDGAITYLGRGYDMMNAGGFRVSPIEVEEVMHDCPGAGDVAAVEIAVKADASVIALAYTGDVEEDSLRAHAEARLARYKQPRLYAHIAALPRNRNGKVLRSEIRAMLQQEVTS
ncbi:MULTISPECIES: class I adenylate-forming enzyme family protein [Thioclava]|uniref:class I adenylate-forming enzyme family protein n=1 Tax=Thioclava TaxID=285107 RepID=UPI000C4EAC31|nr:MULTISPECIES: class I adenylate-forming enzyme family protein [Thioclava]MAQ36697.1 benzoate--CoA ligase [Thioclava sp.]